jgi:hypothetical protein
MTAKALRRHLDECTMIRLTLVLLFVSATAAIMLFCQPASAATLAFDDASQPAYADGWQAGDNGGSGFGPWTLAYSGETTGLFHAPQFIDTIPLAANSLGSPAFALTTGDRPFFTDTSEARRTLLAPISVGQTFSADVDGSAISPTTVPFFTGNTFDMYGADGIERFSLFTNKGYHNDHWTATGDADTGIQAESSFHLELTLVTPDTYTLILSPVGGGAPLFSQIAAPLAGTTGAGIQIIRISDYGTGSSQDGTKEVFFDNLALSSPTGDYNGNGTVDAADYVVWRKTLGQFVQRFFGADGDGSGKIDDADFDVWRSHFGSGQPPGGVAAAVPEPVNSAGILLLLLLAWIFAIPAICRDCRAS